MCGGYGYSKSDVRPILSSKDFVLLCYGLMLNPAKLV
jgi:hypothetical protein